ncbi:MAG: hypothetical protein WEB00_00905 [Dehalococcoidia bacterium]
MDERSARLPVVRATPYPVVVSPMQVLATTAKRGAALMAAGAVARIVLKHVVGRILSPEPTLPQTRSESKTIAVRPEAQPATVVEEVFVYRRRTYRR